MPAHHEKTSKFLSYVLRHRPDEIGLNLPPKEPPKLLYHGTAARFLDAIRREGLKAMSRQHVHLSPDQQTAHKVGQRHGKPVILTIKSGEMWRLFFLSENGVWLTEKFDGKYIDIP